MSKTSKKEIVGLTFGSLTVLNEIEERDKNGWIMYNVICKCGKTKKVLGSSLRYGLSRSCNKCHTLTGSHGMYKTKEFSKWGNMKDRCYNVNNPRYKNYGNRGIIVCERWKDSFKNFISDMGECNGLTLDRINVNGNYEPSNCRWATPKTQSRNRTNNTYFSYLGKTMCMSEWCEKIKMPMSTFNNRLIRGWSINKIIETPIVSKHRKKLTI